MSNNSNYSNMRKYSNNNYYINKSNIAIIVIIREIIIEIRVILLDV